MNVPYPGEDCPHFYFGANSSIDDIRVYEHLSNDEELRIKYALNVARYEHTNTTA